jgi:hypothetical protein
MTTIDLRAERVELDDPFDAIDLFHARGWTDGLPIIPPTPERVAAMLSTVNRAPDEIAARMPVRRREVSVEKIAINAVMAGCLPEYFPVVLTAVEALCEPPFSLHGPSASTGGAAMMVIVHGPIARELSMNHGVNLFGQGNRANASIGRAVRLVLINCFGAIPGELDRATIAHPGKYSYCIAENEEESAWEPLGVARGLQPGESGVTVFAAEGPHQIHNETATTPEKILDSYVAALRDAGNLSGPRAGDYLLVIVPQHMAYIRAAGWTRPQAQEYVFEQARVTAAEIERAGKVWRSGEGPAPVVAAAEDFMLIHAGGNAGGMGAVVPPWLGKSSRPVTRAIPR